MKEKHLRIVLHRPSGLYQKTVSMAPLNNVRYMQVEAVVKRAKEGKKGYGALLERYPTATDHKEWEVIHVASSKDYTSLERKFLEIQVALGDMAGVRCLNISERKRSMLEVPTRASGGSVWQALRDGEFFVAEAVAELRIVSGWCMETSQPVRFTCEAEVVGFVTSDNRIVDSKEAFEIALEAGQIKWFQREALDRILTLEMLEL